ncbi:hypothetical protein RclHR1_13940002 [Rhizophagus clarus]|uniref:Uncharacterized protein n=1 Tax=Rhizophagus clarus TaxID=94130 RepID=A0A2Z6QR29_9GLOM|nr:hypothetical protein RclHR1_13940002 [Rhizophagus clarus]
MRGIIEGLLIRSIEFYGYNRSLSNEQLLKEAWIRVQDINFSVYELNAYELCYKAFEYLLRLVEEQQLVELGLPATKEEVLNFLKTKEPNISRDQEVILALSKENTYLELELAKLRNRFEVKQLSDIISPNEYYDFPRLSQELKRLKIQDLTIQIPLKKQEREQLTNTLKNNLNNSGKYLLDKLLKKQNKLLLNNEINSNKLEEIKTALGEDLEDDSERLTEILDKNKEIFNLEKHLESLRTP